MKEGLNNLEKKRAILNKLVENIDDLNDDIKSSLQQISEEVDILILDYIKNNEPKL